MLTNLTSASLVVVSLSSSSSSSLPPYCLLRSTAASLLSPPALFPVRCPHLYVRYVALCGVRLTNPTSFPSSLRSLALTASNAALHRHHPRTLSRLSTHRPAKPLVAVPPSHPTYRLSHYPAASNPLALPSTRSRHPIALPAVLSPLDSLCATPLSGLFFLSTAVSLCPLFLSPSLDSPLPPSLALSLSLCRSTPFPLFFPALPLPRDARCNPLRANQHTRKPRDARASERASERHDGQLCDYLLSDRLCRACMCVRVCADGRERGVRIALGRPKGDEKGREREKETEKPHPAV